VGVGVSPWVGFCQVCRHSKKFGNPWSRTIKWPRNWSFQTISSKVAQHWSEVLRHWREWSDMLWNAKTRNTLKLEALQVANKELLFSLQPRGDYRELLELAINFLDDVPLRGIRLWALGQKWQRCFTPCGCSKVNFDWPHERAVHSEISACLPLCCTQRLVLQALIQLLLWQMS
jgi:hypothetical protein